MRVEPRIEQRQVPDGTDDLPDDLHPVLRRIYLSRHLTQSQHLGRSLHGLLPFDGMLGIQHAAARLVQAIRLQQRIVIVADFDADGATSCAVAVRALRAMGAQHVDFIVPNRFEYGYGLTPEIIAAAMPKQPELIITVDNGISSVEGVEYARRHGIAVLITDHHLPGKQLPAAEAIVNPNQPGCGFASKSIAGVGVIFYVMLALRAQLRAENYFTEQNIAEPPLASLLDLVALGTVADVVCLDHNNRILVEQGLRRIRAQQACVGMLTLLRVAGRQPAGIHAADLAFTVAPRLNAAGRLHDMSVGIQCLLSDDETQVCELAATLDRLNQERRSIESAMRDEALVHLEKLNGAADNDAANLPSGLCLFDPNWHEGVIGIVAGRLKDRLHRPVIVFARNRDGMLKGSARSISGLHIRDTLDLIATRYPHLLNKFGGHAMAAGLSLREADFAEFSRVFDGVVREQLDGEALQRVIYSDGQLQAGELNLPFAQLLQQAGPWGQGFPEPRFDGCFDIVQSRWVGERHLKLVVKVDMQGTVYDAIYFNAALGETAPPPRAHLVYRLDVNEYQGQTQLQLVVEHLQAV